MGALPETPETKTRSSIGLSLRGLRVFVALEEAKSVAGAAQRLCTSTSGVSQHITALEKSVGAKLFDRRAKPVTLTPAGQVLRTHAHRILTVVSEAETDLAEINLSSLPMLNLAIIDDLDASLTPILVSSLQARLSRCFINAFSGRSDHIIERLQTRQADIGVAATLPVDANAFRVVPILRESFILVSAKGKIVKGEDWRAVLTRLPFVQYSEAMPIGQTVAAHLKRIRLIVSRRFAFEATRSVIATVAQTGGWTLTTPLNLLDAGRFLSSIDIAALPFPGFTRHIHLIARSGEFGHLPEDLARDCRRMARERLVPDFAAIAPELANLIEVADD